MILLFTVNIFMKIIKNTVHSDLRKNKTILWKKVSLFHIHTIYNHKQIPEIMSIKR